VERRMPSQLQRRLHLAKIHLGEIVSAACR
jgi:hypothetical protein